MKKVFKFKDSVPVLIWTNKTDVSNFVSELQYIDGSLIYISLATSYREAMERIYVNSKYSLYLKDDHKEKFVFGLLDYIDSEDEDMFYLLLEDFSNWYKFIDMDYKDETK